MEMTPEETLKQLAMYYNEQYTWAEHLASSISIHARKVVITHIKTEVDKHMYLKDGIPQRPDFLGGYTYETKRAYLVRVSCCHTSAYNEWSETKWEGPLEDWYKALYENILAATQGRFENKLGEVKVVVE